MYFRKKKSKNYRSEENHKITHSHSVFHKLQMLNSSIFHSSNITLIQSYIYPILYSFNILHSFSLTLFESYICLILHSSCFILFQSYTLTFLHTYTLTPLHSLKSLNFVVLNMVTIFQVWSTYLLLTQVNTRDPIGSKNIYPNKAHRVWFKYNTKAVRLFFR